MAKLTRDDVLKLAQLAQIDVSDADVATFTGEFNEILQYIEQLKEVDIEGYEPTSQVTGLTNATRKDEVKSYGYEATDLLENVPRLEDGEIKVERMIE